MDAPPVHCVKTAVGYNIAYSVVGVYLEFDTLAVTRAFAEGQQLREAMQAAGIQGAPSICFVEHI
jgi:hypothetical protein